MLARLTTLVRSGLLMLVCLGAWAQTAVQSVPALSSHVIDQTGTLNAAQRQALDNRLVAFEQEKGTQLVVLIVATTAPEDIASYANRVGNAWKIGRKAVGDGLLLIVAKNDRKLRIEVAKALEGAVPDLAAKRVIDQAITPHFKQGDYAGGVQAGVEQLMQLVGQEGLPAPTAGAPQDNSADTGIDNGLIIFLTVAIVMLALSRRRARHGHSVVSRGMHTGAWGGASSGGWSSASSGNDSFGSGGGGDFGGGGASGDW